VALLLVSAAVVALPVVLGAVAGALQGVLGSAAGQPGVAAVATAADAGSVPSSTSVAASGAPGGSTGEVYVVGPGDSLWSIAAELRPDGDVRPVVDELARRAGGPSLQVGQRIDVDGLRD
jgi:Tfp pilus assembly protein FimV